MCRLDLRLGVRMALPPCLGAEIAALVVMFPAPGARAGKRQGGTCTSDESAAVHVFSSNEAHCSPRKPYGGLTSVDRVHLPSLDTSS